MEIRLGPETEKILMKSLAETLRAQSERAESAFREGNWSLLKKAGHQLRGNSAALYFKLDTIKEIGQRWELHPHVQADEFERQMAQLKGIIRDLEEKACAYL